LCRLPLLLVVLRRLSLLVLILRLRLRLACFLYLHQSRRLHSLYYILLPSRPLLV